MSEVQAYTRGKDDIVNFVHQILPYPPIKNGVQFKDYSSTLKPDELTNFAVAGLLMVQFAKATDADGAGPTDVLTAAFEKVIAGGDPVISASTKTLCRAMGRTIQIDEYFQMIERAKKEHHSNSALTAKFDVVRDALKRAREPSTRMSLNEGIATLLEVSDIHQAAGTESLTHRPS